MLRLCGSAESLKSTPPHAPDTQLQTAVEEASPPNLYELRTEVERLRNEVSDLRREVAIIYKCIKQLGESPPNRSK
jgi:hypothetical protein